MAGISIGSILAAAKKDLGDAGGAVIHAVIPSQGQAQGPVPPSKQPASAYWQVHPNNGVTANEVPVGPANSQTGIVPTVAPVVAQQELAARTPTADIPTVPSAPVIPAGHLQVHELPPQAQLQYHPAVGFHVLVK